MPREYPSDTRPDFSIIEDALAALDADALRTLMLDMLPHFDARLEARFASEALRRAGGMRQGWSPQAPDEALLGEIEAFAQRALMQNYADPSEVDAYLCEGSTALRETTAARYAFITRCCRPSRAPTSTWTRTRWWTRCSASTSKAACCSI